MTFETALRDEHVAAGAKMVEFAGWSMPLHYGSQVAEHHAVRGAAGMFDVSHMATFDLPLDASPWLRTLLVSDVTALEVGHARYTVMLNDSGGVIDDLIVYRRADSYRMITNAGTRARVVDWLRGHGDPAIAPRDDLSIVAVQGPEAIEKLRASVGIDAKDVASFTSREAGGWLIGRTGYTGEDGVELFLPNADVVEFWRKLRAAGVEPCGLGARDTLRLEAGLNLNGHDMDESVSPLQANLAWTVDWDAREFIGRDPLAAEREARPERVLRGLVLAEKGVVREGQTVRTDRGDGVMTSGLFSPTLGYSIGLVRLPRGASGECSVDIRGRWKSARIVKPPFVRHGSKVFK